MTKRHRSKGWSPDTGGDNIVDYRYSDTRKNNPPAGLAAKGRIAAVPKQKYYYDPHLPPALRFDATRKADKLPELLQISRKPLQTYQQYVGGGLQDSALLRCHFLFKVVLTPSCSSSREQNKAFLR